MFNIKRKGSILILLLLTLALVLRFYRLGLDSYAVWLPVLLSFAKISAFWIKPLPGDWLDSAKRRIVDSLFIKVKEQRFLDAWAQLYERRPETGLR
jgi:hypothetical protein